MSAWVPKMEEGCLADLSTSIVTLRKNKLLCLRHKIFWDLSVKAVFLLKFKPRKAEELEQNLYVWSVQLGLKID